MKTINAIPPAMPPTAAPITTPELFVLEDSIGAFEGNFVVFNITEGADSIGAFEGNFVVFNITEGADSIGAFEGNFVVFNVTEGTRVGSGAETAAGSSVVGVEGLGWTYSLSKQPFEPVPESQYSLVDIPTIGTTRDSVDPIGKKADSPQATLNVPFLSVINSKSCLGSAHSDNKSP
jgi:hypothetical protein